MATMGQYIHVDNSTVSTGGSIKKKDASGNWQMWLADVQDGQHLSLSPGSYLYKYSSGPNGAYNISLREVGTNLFLDGPKPRTVTNAEDLFEFRVS